jgi:hypothetical protein
MHYVPGRLAIGVKKLNPSRSKVPFRDKQEAYRAILVITKTRLQMLAVAADHNGKGTRFCVVLIALVGLRPDDRARALG